MQNRFLRCIFLTVSALLRAAFLVVLAAASLDQPALSQSLVLQNHTTFTRYQPPYMYTHTYTYSRWRSITLFITLRLSLRTFVVLESDAEVWQHRVANVVTHRQQLGHFLLPRNASDVIAELRKYVQVGYDQLFFLPRPKYAIIRHKLMLLHVLAHVYTCTCTGMYEHMYEYAYTCYAN